MNRSSQEYVRIDSAKLEDYESFALLFPELGTGDPPPDRQRWLEEVVSTTLFVRIDDVVAGYLHYNLLKETGYIRQIVVAPSFRGRCLGRLLMAEMAQRFQEKGARSWRLNVKPDNVPAVRLYRSMGLSRAYASTALRISWGAVSCLPNPIGIEARVIRPSDEAMLETALDLPSGQIGDARRLNRVLLWLKEGGNPAGIAVFAPTFPGAFPFRVARAELARDLLEAIRPYASPDFPYVQVVAENHPAMADSLLRAGAEVRFQMEHYRGPLPAGPSSAGQGMGGTQ